MRQRFCVTWFAAILGSSACADEATVHQTATCDDSNMLSTLATIDGVVRVAGAPCGGYVTGEPRCFAIEFDQPIDHEHAASRFSQRLFLIHRGCSNPNLVGDLGYSNDAFFDDELSTLFDTNVLWIEHRFQGESLPSQADWDWTQLTIANGAGDMHRVIAAFRAYYEGRFVSTGASKGGITATYHKYLFGDDVDGSVAYVAPASRDRIDPEYQTNLAVALPSPCADQVRDAQVAALTSRLPMMVEELSRRAPGQERANLDYMVAYADWSFWQSYGASECAGVPSTTTEDPAFYDFFATVSGVFEFEKSQKAGDPVRNDELSQSALDYEWLTEQGFALQIGRHVLPLLEPAALATMEQRFREVNPSVALPTYDGSLTTAMNDWVRDQAEDLLLIYGAFDPWTGGALNAPNRRSSARLSVPEGSHDAQIGDLEPADRAVALEHASRMFGRQPLAMKRETSAGRHALLDRVRRERQQFELRSLRRSVFSSQ